MKGLIGKVTKLEQREMKGLIGKVTKLEQRDYERAYRKGYKAAEAERL